MRRDKKPPPRKSEPVVRERHHHYFRFNNKTGEFRSFVVSIVANLDGEPGLFFERWEGKTPEKRTNKALFHTRTVGYDWARRVVSRSRVFGWGHCNHCLTIWQEQCHEDGFRGERTFTSKLT